MNFRVSEESQEESLPVAAGVWFPLDAHDELRGLRQGHFWFENRYRILAEVLEGLEIRSDGLSAEIGCGDGYMLSALPGRRMGLEINLKDLLAARKRSSEPLVCATAVLPPLRKAFDLLCAFDVLEHLEDDVAFLRACHACLTSAGRLVLTVPSGPELWSRRDEYAGHFRRYTDARLQATVQEAGFKVETLFPFFRMLWPMARLSARLESVDPVKGVKQAFTVNRLLNVILRIVIRGEWLLLGKSRWGRGTSLCVIASRQSDEIVSAAPER